jgi:putative oxidoreductase
MNQMNYYANTALRILAGIVFIIHGKFKLDWGYVNLSNWLDEQGFPFSIFIGYLLPWVEVVGGLILIIGLGTRYVATIFSIILVAALFKVKLSAGFISTTATGYEFESLLLVVSIHIALTGDSPANRLFNKKSKEGNLVHV